LRDAIEKIIQLKEWYKISRDVNENIIQLREQLKIKSQLKE
jgi:hypothetical protein